MITKLKNVRDIVCGSTFVFCVDFKDKVWCFGDNSAGYLGLPHNKNIFIPLLHPFFNNMNVKYIRCGSRHCLFILYNGECFLCGSDSNGQCANSGRSGLKDILYPDPQMYHKKVKNGWCGSHHTVPLTIEDEWISFGAVKF